MASNVKEYIINVLLGIDQLANAVTFGWPDETLSSRSYRKRDQNKFFFFTQKFINLLFFWQEDHCKKSFESEKYRRHFPETLREFVQRNNEH